MSSRWLRLALLLVRVAETTTGLTPGTTSLGLGLG